MGANDKMVVFLHPKVRQCVFDIFLVISLFLSQDCGGVLFELEQR